jgi:hypothetical protein
VKGHVTRRSDDPHGQGFGNVKTGFVSSTKLSFLQRASSLDRDGSPVPSIGSSSGGRSKGLRVTWAESPGSSRPASNLGWSADGGAAARAQTPPLAGEWAAGASAKTLVLEANKSSLSQQSFGQSIVGQSAGGFAELIGPPTTSVLANTMASGVANNTTSTMASAANFQANSKQMSFQSSQHMSFQSSQQMSSSSTFQSSKQMSSSSMTASAASFSSVKSTSLPVQSGKMHTFEAFPGLGEIENLCLEQGERVGK